MPKEIQLEPNTNTFNPLEELLDVTFPFLRLTNSISVSVFNNEI